MFRCTPVAGFNKVLRDIDPQHVRSEFRLWQCGCSIAASEVQNLEPFRDSQALDERLSAFSHTLRNACKVAFFPKCFVWIHWSTPSDFNCAWGRLRQRTSFEVLS